MRGGEGGVESLTGDSLRLDRRTMRPGWESEATLIVETGVCSEMDQSDHSDCSSAIYSNIHTSQYILFLISSPSWLLDDTEEVVPDRVKGLSRINGAQDALATIIVDDGGGLLMIGG